MSVISLMGTVGLLKTSYIYYFIEIKDGFSEKKKKNLKRRHLLLGSRLFLMCILEVW